MPKDDVCNASTIIIFPRGPGTGVSPQLVPTFPPHVVHQDFLFGSRTSENDPNKDRIFRKRGSLSLVLGHVVTSLSFCI